MKGIRLNTTTAGKAVFDFKSPVDTIEALAQNASVLVVTKVGSSTVIPAKGTSLQQAGARGLMFNLLASQHHLNFAALDVLSILRNNQDDTTPSSDQINNVVIEAQDYSVGNLKTNLIVTAQDGKRAGRTIL